MLPYKNPLAYKQLRTWTQAKEILELTEEFVKTLPQKEPARGHMDRSARSTVRNIEEGFRRTTTQEYVNFLGFSAGSNEELLGDYGNCLKGNKGDKGMALKGEYLCKGEGKMLHNQIVALQGKMYKEKTLGPKDQYKMAMTRQKEKNGKFDQWLQNQVGKNNGE